MYIHVYMFMYMYMYKYVYTPLAGHWLQTLQKWGHLFIAH